METIPTPGTPVRPPPSSLAGGLVRAARPRQWVKNVLVLAAPGAAGVLDRADVAVDVALAFAALCLVASGLYLFNDILDRDADRAHPTKRNRPIAAGVVPVPTATAAGVGLLAAGLAVGALPGEWELLAVLGAYIVITLAYGAWLKHEPVVDLAAVASGFVFRALAGAYAVALPISDWFLIVALFGSLLMVTGKRRAELTELEDAVAHREVLASYTVRYLDHVLAAASGVVILAYCLWAFETAAGVEYGVLHRVSVVPFTLAILRYVLDIEEGKGGAPEDVVLGDRGLQVLGLVWAAVFGLGTHLG